MTKDNVEKLPVPREPLAAGAPVRAIVPRTMEEAFRLATAVVEAELAPTGLKTQPQCLIAILQGLEVGLTPMQAIQRIAVINGRATIWGDAAMGLVRASGVCESVKEWIEGEGDDMTAHCHVKRKGEREPIKGAFSVADAKLAGLWDRGMYQKYPKRMLQMRARGFALRDGFADVLGGLYIREEIEGSEPIDITPAEVPSPSPPTAPIEPPSPSAVQHKKPAKAKRSSKPYAGETIEAEAFDPDKWLDEIAGVMAGAKDQPTLDEVWNEQIQPKIESGSVFPPDVAKAEKLFQENIERIEKAAS